MLLILNVLSMSQSLHVISEPLMVICTFVFEFSISCFYACYSEECKVLVELLLSETQKLLLLPFTVTLKDKCLVDARCAIVAKCFVFEVYLEVVCSCGKNFFFSFCHLTYHQLANVLSPWWILFSIEKC